MKRGEVVDAETAAKLVSIINREMNTHDPFRAVMWPSSQLRKIENLSSTINLLNRPVRRKLLHLLCSYDDLLIALLVQPTISDDGYGVLMTIGIYDYDGNNGRGAYDGPLFFSDDEAVKDKVQSFIAQGDKSIIFKSVEALSSKPALTSSDEFELLMLRSAIELEQFAFSPRTSFKRREPSKQTMNRVPSLKRWPPIEIVNLRLPEKREAPHSEGRKLMIQVYVKGHLRWQWYPSLQTHKLIEIKEHIRGPKDAPLKPKPTKVYKVTR